MLRRNFYENLLKKYHPQTNYLILKVTLSCFFFIAKGKYTNLYLKIFDSELEICPFGSLYSSLLHGAIDTREYYSSSLIFIFLNQTP